MGAAYPVLQHVSGPSSLTPLIPRASIRPARRLRMSAHRVSLMVMPSFALMSISLFGLNRPNV